MKTVVLKLSGELFGSSSAPVDEVKIVALARKVIEFKTRNEVKLVIIPGGGNILRGRQVEGSIISRTRADNTGMLATIINAEWLEGALKSLGAETRNMTAISVRQVAEEYIPKKALSHLRKDFIVIISGGTGRTSFTTDSAAAVYAVELDADVILKATHVDGVYDKDPRRFPDARRFAALTFQEALMQQLEIMDPEAFAKCRSRNKPVVVFHIDDLAKLNLDEPGDIGTWITN